MSEVKTSRIGAAVRLTVLATVFSGLLQAAVVVILARFIGPREYGAYALCIAVLSVSTNFITASTERSLIVKEEVDYRGLLFATTGLLLLTSALTMAICWALTVLHWMVVRLDLLAVLLLGGVLAGAGIGPRVFLRRKLDFRWIVIGEICGLALGTGVTSIVLAVLGFGPFSLVVGALVQNAIAFGVLLLGGAGGASFAISGSAFTATTRGAMTVSRLSALEVANSQIPNFFLNHLGAAALGLYNRSQTIVQLPVQLLTSSMTRVMISGISAVAAERARLVRASRLLIMTTSALIGPVNFGIAGSHAQFTEILLGKTWAAAAPLIPIMALTSWAIMTATVIGVVSEAGRHFKQKAVAQGIASALLVILLAVGVRVNLMWASSGIALGGLVLFALNVGLTARTLEVSPWRLLNWLSPGIVAGLGCGAYTLSIAWVLRAQPAAIVFPIQIVGCGVLTAGYFLVWRRDVLFAVAEATLPASMRQLLARWVSPQPGQAHQ